MTAALVHLPEKIRQEFGRRPFLATHTLEHHELFSDTALAALLDSFPRQHLYASTMGHDPTRPVENRLTVHDGISGSELLCAVRTGRLWLYIARVDRIDSEYRELIERLYEQLAAQVSGFDPIACQGALSISSPNALAYYRADASASALWHIRGRRRIWIYPALDECYASQEFLEDVFACARHDHLPYRPGFDAGAVRYDLLPGQWATWPQNAPYRVINLDGINVSLSTQHFTDETSRRQRVYLANRFFRTHLRMRGLSGKETGVVAAAKIAAHRAAYKCGLDRGQYRSQVASLRFDANQSNSASANFDRSAAASLSAPLK